MSEKKTQPHVLSEGASKGSSSSSVIQELQNCLPHSTHPVQPAQPLQQISTTSESKDLMLAHHPAFDSNAPVCLSLPNPTALSSILSEIALGVKESQQS